MPTTLVMGWWEVLSFLRSWVALVSNIENYLESISLRPSREPVPVLSPVALEMILPHIEGVFARLRPDNTLEDEAFRIAESTGLAPGQVMLAVKAVGQSV